MLDITGKIAEVVGDSGVSEGLCHIFVPHTTAALTINENADPDVRSDMLRAFSRIVPDDIEYDHSEGNSPAHVMSSILNHSQTLFVEGERLVLGTWQGIYLCEFDGPRSRKVYVKVVEG